jgi:aryl-alcohol dehydrogenase-like predicted oxidoreductase
VRTGKRADIFLATKFGFWHKDGRTINGDPEYVRQATESSLKKLGVETIDLMYLHVRILSTCFFLSFGFMDS